MAPVETPDIEWPRSMKVEIKKPTGTRRYYVIPVDIDNKEDFEKLLRLQEYGITIVDLFAAVWNEIIDDDLSATTQLGHLITATVSQRWYEMRLASHSSTEHLLAETDDLMNCAIDICEEFNKTLPEYMGMIVKCEVEATQCDHSLWGILGVVGAGMIVFCEDPSNIGVASELHYVQLR